MTLNKDLIDAAKGSLPCDLNLVNCTIVDVLQGELRRNATISIIGGVIAGVDDRLRATRTMDMHGLYCAPGLVDSHVHIESSLLIPSEYARVVLPRGTTSVVADPHEIVNVLGYEGMRYMIAESEGLPLDIYFMVPSCVPATDFDTAGAEFRAADMYPFLREARVLGLGEVMNYSGVLGKDPGLLDKIALFRDAMRPIDGHAPGLSGAALSAYIATGIGSDHECTTPGEALEKIGKGMYVMMREGSTAKDVRTLLPAVTSRTIHRFLLCSDDRHPNDLIDEGHIDHAMRLLLKGGLSLVDAFTIGSLNPAQWFGISTMGALAPGYKADLVVFEDPENFAATMVFKNGVMVARDGRLLIDFAPAKTLVPRDSVNIKWLEETDFAIPAPLKSDQKIRVIDVEPGSIISRQYIVSPTVRDGECVSNPELDIIKIFVIERHTGTGNIGKGFIRGLGIREGAIGLTVSHDSHNMVIAGVDDASIFKAAKHLNKIKGGMVFTIGEQVVLDLALPVAGLMSNKSASEVAEALRNFEAVFRQRGFANPTPLMTLSFMALPVIPSLKITDRGLIDVDAFAPVSLYFDSTNERSNTARS